MSKISVCNIIETINGDVARKLENKKIFCNARKHAEDRPVSMVE